MKKLKPKINNLNSLAETKYLSLYNAEYTNKKGDSRSWIVASRKNIDILNLQLQKKIEERVDAVMIVALHEESKKLVLVKQFRVPLNDYVYELPAGLVDGDEDIKFAVSRELKEETGLKVVDIVNKEDIKALYVSVGMTDESVALVYCYCSGEISNAYLEDDEDIEVCMVSPLEAKKLIDSNPKMDIKVYMMLKAFAALGEEIMK
ncbi:NUDIX hydrolase [Clostridium manihotivorum]|uniref:DNA mismatch repair protein MutT n=1 Tax=Clostridium manihotivorum TaxID=2320868 RepID=A0A410DNV8_9CLOT|nr:NUDIX hydrolase [Clostridium manihotivorum]QAA30717.1 DNA mismatch repair protein MutT [Clostridium manihotivorum]